MAFTIIIFTRILNAKSKVIGQIQIPYQDPLVVGNLIINIDILIMNIKCLVIFF